MKRHDAPFALPKNISPGLNRVRDYWAGLKRGGNDIPFSDDLRLTELSDIAPTLILLDVFALPQRFRLSVVGASWGNQGGSDAAGRFLDEIQPAPNFEYLQSQCAATVESGKPTWYAAYAGSPGAGENDAYERLLLPMWNDGRINMIVGAIDRPQVSSTDR